jgi:putative tricarboxylic transport membrane protein
MGLDSDTGKDEAAIGSRWPEVGLAAFLLALAALVVVDSLRVGIGWADDGPRAGLFPFSVGLALGVPSAVTLVRALLGRGDVANEAFATREQIGRVFAVFLPAVIYGAAMPFVGLYVASFALIAYFMKRHGAFGWPITMAVAAGVPIAFFLVFERWFLVLLPKGPLERLLGF